MWTSALRDRKIELAPVSIVGDQQQQANATGRDRIVVFADSSSAHAQFLTAALISAAHDAGDVAVAAVMDTGSVDRVAFLWSCVAWLVARLFDPGFRKPRPCSPSGLRTICRKASVPYRAAGKSDPTTWNVQANVLVSIYCLRKFSREFLEKFDYAVNYHNGPLPAYRGLLATNWELYRSEATFGFTFHRLSEGIDEGNVLARESVNGDGNEYKFQLERLKTRAAAKYWPEIIDKMKGRDDGTPQSGPAGSYTRRKFLAIRAVDDPASITRSDLERRIRYFEQVSIPFGGRVLPVSAIETSTGGSRFDFVTADGETVRAVRFAHLPYSLYMLGRIFGRLRSLLRG